MSKISVSYSGATLTLLNSNLKYEIERDGVKWINQGRPAHITFQRHLFGKYRWYFALFLSAKHKSHKRVGNSIVSTFSGFIVYGKSVPVTLIATATILENGKVDFSIDAKDEGDCDLKAICYPTPFNVKNYDKDKAYSVDPLRQGFMLPDTYKDNRRAIFLLTKYWRKINTGDAYMPVWGRVCCDYGYSAYADESYDATLYSCYGKKKAFLTAINWMSSLGKLDYKRTVHFRFYKDCNYVSIAKDFRQHEKDSGNLVTLDEKIKSNPNVKKLIGSPVIHWCLYSHNCKGTQIYKKSGYEDKIHNTFDETCEKLRMFKKYGLEKAYVHTDGWGNRGYDNLHPYILPPSDKIGGYAGMKRLSDTCSQIGYCFGLHDQYRDYYQDSPVYNKDECCLDVNGKAWYCDIWAGGPHNWLCSKFAKGYVKRTYDELSQNDIHIDGTYLDVFSIVPGDECYSPDHRITRKQSIEYRGECFDMLRQKGLIVSSEETGSQMVKYLDLVHHAPYGVSPMEGGPQIGIPIPFSNLVYHDCVFVPWLTEGRGGYGIPDKDCGKLHCILNAQLPYFNNSMVTGACEEDLNKLKEQIKNVNEIAKI